MVKAGPARGGRFCSAINDLHVDNDEKLYKERLEIGKNSGIPLRSDHK